MQRCAFVSKRSKRKGKEGKKKREMGEALSVAQWQSNSRVCWGLGFDSRQERLQFVPFLPKLHFTFVMSFPKLRNEADINSVFGFSIATKSAV